MSSTCGPLAGNVPYIPCDVQELPAFCAQAEISVSFGTAESPLPEPPLLEPAPPSDKQLIVLNTDPGTSLKAMALLHETQRELMTHDPELPPESALSLAAEKLGLTHMDLRPTGSLTLVNAGKTGARAEHIPALDLYCAALQAAERGLPVEHAAR
jgi:hypothetical protein